MMRAFLHQHFPVLDGEMDDILQETYLSLCNALPNYRYEPEELGSFHNYLTGILRNRALRALREREKALDPDVLQVFRGIVRQRS